MNPKDELLPCPFCGGTNTDLEDVSGCGNGVFNASCNDCDFTLGGFTARKFCVSKWNTRHTPQPSVDSGMKSAEDIIKKWSKLYNDRYNELDSEATEKIGDGVVPSEDIHEIIIREILQDAFAAGVRSTKER